MPRQLQYVLIKHAASVVAKTVSNGRKVCRTSKAKCCVVGMIFAVLTLAESRSVSQFTLLASTKKGNKPDFHGAASGEQARELYDKFYGKIQELYETDKVKNGIFQAMMEGISWKDNSP